ncbi:MAG: DUF1254 domain-containing protein [Hyphomonadaceae bacterium]|nr:DUF1254 domain-containing protein [Hyphomonadaceae bacterium]
MPMLSRREIALTLCGGVAFFGSKNRPPAADIAPAFNLAFPLFEFARTAWTAAGPNANAPNGAFNSFLHRRRLTDPSQRAITATNNDCLVSNARIDLSGGPVLLTVPEIKDRYFSLAFMDAFTDNFHFIGTRSTGGLGGTFLLRPPGSRFPPPAGAMALDCPSQDIWILARILVSDPSDAANVNALQDRLILYPASTNAPRAGAVAATGDARQSPNALLRVANAMLARVPANDSRVRRAARYRRIGLARGHADAFERLPEALQAEWRDSLPQLLRSLATADPRRTREVDGWYYSAASLGAFGDNDFLRAQTALIGLAALPPEEAFYGHALSARDGAPLTGEFAYRLRVPASPPVDAFWSVTMYQVEGDGRLFLTPNPIGRYSIGNRTQALRYNEDGSLDVYLSAAPPPDAWRSNWLPAPPGAFRPAFRAYLARPELRNLTWRLPPVERIM